MWQLIDNSDGKTKGYLMILKDGKRVADAFPWAKNADPDWVRAQAVHLVEQMNLADMLQTEKYKHSEQ